MLILKIRLSVCWIFLIGSCIGWPWSQLTVAKDEPTFTLGLSWLAIILTAADLLSTTYVRYKQAKQDQEQGHDGKAED